MTTLIVEIQEHIAILDRKYYDPLQLFVARHRQEISREELPKLQEKFLQQLFKISKGCNLRFLFIGKGELCGCEGIQYDGWSALWYVSRQLGINSCGNFDQSQTSDYRGLYFPPDSYGGWDLRENRKLTDAETETKSFNRVVTRDRSKDKK